MYKIKTIDIGYNEILKKRVEKVILPKQTIDELSQIPQVRFSNPLSNIAICFVYTWREEPDIELELNRFSAYSSITGFLKTVYGINNLVTNIIKNPNINKLVLLTYNQKDNAHLVVDSIKKLYLNQIKGNKIHDSKSSNPFLNLQKQVISRFQNQLDLISLTNLKKSSDENEIILELLNTLVSYPKDAKKSDYFSKKGIQIEYLSNIMNDYLYDDGARFKDIPKTKTLIYSNEFYSDLNESHIITELNKRILTINNISFANNIIVHFNPNLDNLNSEKTLHNSINSDEKEVSIMKKENTKNNVNLSSIILKKISKQENIKSYQNLFYFEYSNLNDSELILSFSIIKKEDISSIINLIKTEYMPQFRFISLIISKYII